MAQVPTSNSPLSIQLLETIYRRSYGRFLRVALAIVGDPETAHEVVQEAFANAIRKRFQFRADSSPDAWLWQIVVNVATSIIRRRPASPAPADSLSVSNGHAAEWPELRAAVAALPERQRLAVFLRHYADLDYEQIASVLQVERGTVAATLHKAHATLRKQLSEVVR